MFPGISAILAGVADVRRQVARRGTDGGVGVRINIPLIPVYIEVRWRHLGPFRFTLRRLMLAVAITGICSSLLAYSVRLRTVGSYHAQQSILVTPVRSESPPYGLTPLVNWHVKMSHHYHDAASRLEWVIGIISLTLIALGVVAALGRVFHVLYRRSGEVAAA
jgi:hypothetical protein